MSQALFNLNLEEKHIASILLTRVGDQVEFTNLQLPMKFHMCLSAVGLRFQGYGRIEPAFVTIQTILINRRRRGRLAWWDSSLYPL
ncbi:hypothetical protein SCLCIDRAFT_1217971 [Scleroderma citrinum Foug A]|uniref:Uncharacterized protein n=1 Tax=Scleroderma citrinum Foug A TaxID=1036808 RepID=A0A0C3A3D3_9AGAM|nr:hypothetical protein SCLCIDRAFT_1217971 [Scleroderma citrinum Foug A]